MILILYDASVSLEIKVLKMVGWIVIQCWSIQRFIHEFYTLIYL